MTTTDLRTTFDAVAAAVPVPPIDRVAFERQLRADRRRRLAGRGIVGVAAAAALVVGGGLVHELTTDGGTAGDPATGRSAGSAAGSPQTIAVAAQNRLLVLTPDGTTHPTDVRVEEVVALTDQGAVVVGPDSRVLLVPVRRDGSTGEPRPLVDGRVQRVSVSPDGTEVAYVDLDDVAHVIDIATGQPVGEPEQLDSHDLLRSVDGGTLLVGTGAGMSVLEDGTTTEILAPEEDLAGEMAGGVVSYQTIGGVFLFDADGAARTGELGAGVGGLSTDGATYASAPADWQVDDGMSNDLEVIDTTTGDNQVVQVLDGTAIEIRWTSADRFLVVVDGRNVPGRELLECSTSASACTERYDDPSGTLSLPSR